MLKESKSDIMYGFDSSHRMNFGHVHGSDLSGHWDRPNQSISHQTQKTGRRAYPMHPKKMKKIRLLDISVLSGYALHFLFMTPHEE